MYVARMVGNNDGNGPVIGTFETLEEAQRCCVNKEKELRAALPLHVQQEIQRDFGHYQMEWEKLSDNAYDSSTLPPLTIPIVNGAVCFHVRKRL